MELICTALAMVVVILWSILDVHGQPDPERDAREAERKRIRDLERENAALREAKRIADLEEENRRLRE